MKLTLDASKNKPCWIENTNHLTNCEQLIYEVTRTVNESFNGEAFSPRSYKEDHTKRMQCPLKVTVNGRELFQCACLHEMPKKYLV